MKIVMLFAVCLSLFFSLNAEQPIFKDGIITDTHVTDDKKSCSMLKDTYSLFKNRMSIWLSIWGTLNTLK